MYKIFRIKYNDGGWHSGDLPHYYYIAKNEEDVVANSEKYKQFLEWKKRDGGDIWVSEMTCVVGISGLVYGFEFENLGDFDIEMSVKKKD